MQLAEGIPVAGTGITLPLDLHSIASKCTNAFYAPRRFAAIQMAFSSPRCRILIFHTGRIVGTGCEGPLQARLSVMRATRQLAQEAGIYLHVRKFEIINQVGAVSINARLNCEAFANAHSSTAHYDKDSFVGLAWRPQGESICCEVYSTGRANLPGSRREREMLSSWSRMVAQLLMHSDKPETVELVPEYLRDVHKPSDAARDDAPVLPSSATASSSTAHAPAGMANGKARAFARKRQRQELWDDVGCDGFDDGSPLLPPLTATGPGNGLLGGFSLDEDEGCALLEAAGF
ncbi:MAG: hypothetical protein CMM02_01780 [Rhodopirellula sp.]|nr:hypothetical protein [Rhodopirellula sp.]